MLLAKYCKVLDKRIIDEQKAQKDYEELAPENLNAASRILEIKRDEEDHEKILTKIKKDLCGGLK